jgi:hypothetical protein
MYELERPPHRLHAGPHEAQAERIRDLHRYWLSKCRDGRLPTRAAIDPAEIRALLPHIILAEIETPFAIRYRLVGTAVAKVHGDDFTGRLHGTVTGFAGAGLDESFRRAVERAAPVFGHSGLDAGDGTWIGFEYAILPLSETGGTVDRCLAMECADAPAPIVADEETDGPNAYPER